MKIWDTQCTVMFSIGIGFALMMIVGGITTESNMILGSGIGLMIGVPTVAYLYIRNMKKINKLLERNK